MTTTTTYSSRSNAKRAADAAIQKGTAPSVHYQIVKPHRGSRFEIVWQPTPADAEVIDRDIATERLHELADAGQPQAQPVAQPEQATDAAESPPAPETEANEASDKTEAETASDPFPPGTYVEVRQGRRPRFGHISHRIDERTWRVRLHGAAPGVTIMASANHLSRAAEPEPEKPARQVKTSTRRAAAASPQKPHRRSVGRSRYAIAAEAIAAGRLPDAAPVVTSTANQHYQKHFDKLFGLAKARDWDAVRDYPVTGSNSYSKMVARYRQDLLAVHAAQSTAQPASTVEHAP